MGLVIIDEAHEYLSTVNAGMFHVINWSSGQRRLAGMGTPMKYDQSDILDTLYFLKRLERWNFSILRELVLTDIESTMREAAVDSWKHPDGCRVAELQFTAFSVQARIMRSIAISFEEIIGIGYFMPFRRWKLGV